VIKYLHNVHSYQILRENRQTITEWLAKYYVEEFRDQPNWSKGAMRSTFRKNVGLEFKDVKLWRERRFAKKYIQGCYIKQYSDLWNYSHSILERNPSSYCKVNVNPESLPDKPVFDGLFIS